MGVSNPDIELESFVLRPAKNKSLGTLDIHDAITDARLERTIEGEFSLAVDCTDPEKVILNHPMFTLGGDAKLDAIDVRVDDVWFRLSAMTRQGTTTTLTFDHRSIIYLRAHKGPLKVSRNKSTRAEFVLRLIREVKKTHIPFYSPDLHKKQPIADPEVQAAHDSHKQRVSHTTDIKVDNVKANHEQLANIETCLDIATSEGATELAVKGMLVAGMGESNFLSDSTNPKSGASGVFQFLPSTAKANHVGLFDVEGQCRVILKGGIGIGLGGFIKGAKDNPHMSAGELAAKVEVSDGAASYYNEFSDEADAIIKAYGGVHASTSRVIDKQYAFQRGTLTEPRNSWETILDLASGGDGTGSGGGNSDLGWRAFFDRNTLIFMSEEDLFKAPPVATITSDAPEVISVDWTWDNEQTDAEITVTLFAHRWSFPPGAAVILENEGVATGKWLVASTTRSLFDTQAEITLRQPLPERPEPAHETSEQSSDSGSSSGKTGDVSVVAGADRPGVKTHQYVLDFVSLVAGELGKKLYVTTGSRHNRLSSSGLVSDHWEGNAADLGSVKNHFAIGGKGGDRIAKACAKVLGVSSSAVIGTYDRHEWSHDGHHYSVQVLWKVQGHYDHVHVGVRPDDATPARHKPRIDI